MPRDLRAPAVTPTPSPSSALLHRRHQRVVVRAPGKSALPAAVQIHEKFDRRERLPTLMGLGYRMEADTLPAIGLYDLDDQTPISRVQIRIDPLPPLPPTPLTAEELANFAPENLTALPDAEDVTPFAMELTTLTSAPVAVLSALPSLEEEPVPLSRIRVKALLPPPPADVPTLLLKAARPRPATLLDGVDDNLARRYREEAERILKTGLFELDLDDLE